MTTHNVGRAVLSGTDNLHLDNFIGQLEPDDQLWFVMKEADKQGLSPVEAAWAFKAAKAAELAPDTDWRDHKVTSLALNPVPLLKQAADVCLAASAARSSQQRPDRAASDFATDLPWPPGRAGSFARYVFRRSYSPVAEVAVAATLGMLAGISGRAYQTETGKDLALYLILVAKSGIGKESAHELLPELLRLTDRPLAQRFVRAQDFASGEALHKEMLREPGFLNLQGEFGRKLKRMANPTDSPAQTFRTTMLNGYGKAYLEGKSYSRLEDCMDGVERPALSFLGETTPGTFLECLTPEMMADGFLSRFLVIAYQGDRPMPNKARQVTLGHDDLQSLRALVDHALKYQLPVNAPPPLPVGMAASARSSMEAFETALITELWATGDEAERQVLTRAHLKALKVANLLAVADNPLNPQVSDDHTSWAIGLVRRDMETFQSRHRNGDVGVSDDSRERKIMQIVRDYVVSAPPASYRVPDALHRARVVPRLYLQKRVSSLPAFSQHRAGSARAIDDTIRTLIANGQLRELRESTLVESYGFHGKAYAILNPD